MFKQGKLPSKKREKLIIGIGGLKQFLLQVNLLRSYCKNKSPTSTAGLLFIDIRNLMSEG